MASNAKDQNIEGYIQEEIDERPKVEIPQQFEFYKVPRRFGTIPVDELPLGCDKNEQYYKVYPRVSLPFQKVEKRLVVVCSIEHVKNECEITGTISLIAFPYVFSFSLLVLS
jgi:hypothetical protein